MTRPTDFGPVDVADPVRDPLVEKDVPDRTVRSGEFIHPSNTVVDDSGR